MKSRVVALIALLAGILSALVLVLVLHGNPLYEAAPAKSRAPTEEVASEENIFVKLRLPHEYQVALSADYQSRPGGEDWLTAETPRGGRVELGSRLVVQVKEGARFDQVLDLAHLQIEREVTPNIRIYACTDAVEALLTAEKLERLAAIAAVYPVMRRTADLSSSYAPYPNDPYFDAALLADGNVSAQWYLENRSTNGARVGLDLNVREAWPRAEGQGITVAVVDDGIELSHPDLSNRVQTSFHYNFANRTTDGRNIRTDTQGAHGTSVAGLIAAEGNNRVGMVGVAPKAALASWVIFNTNLTLAADDRLMEMYQAHSNAVPVQNHSWGSEHIYFDGPTLLEQVGISNAIAFGRSGRGVVMVRAGGNNRAKNGNASDDAYVSDPRVIAVAAVQPDGRVISTSEPGASLLVAAPSRDQVGSGLFTTDLTGSNGAVQFGFLPPHTNLWDYRFNIYGFSGTSASAPLISGAAALLLEINPLLHYRDVQQILAFSARQYDLNDPDVRTNGAGFAVSHNTGYGVPDLGFAVWTAQRWPTRPELEKHSLISTQRLEIPDAGLRIELAGPGVPVELSTLLSMPSLGVHPDEPTAYLPLIDVGLATNTIVQDLRGKGALIERGAADYSVKIKNAANAGAAFAIVYNNETGTASCPGGDNVCPMGGTDFVPIPAVFVTRSDGLFLRDAIVGQTGRVARLRLASAETSFAVTNSLLAEHVSVRIKAEHPFRGDLRITLVSPWGTRSVLQTLNSDTNAGPRDWTYHSTHHFHEQARGSWTLAVTDEFEGGVGAITEATMILNGVPVRDQDSDGLDDGWETQRLGSLIFTGMEDPDRDGFNNIREQLLQSDPKAEDVVFKMEADPIKSKLLRLSWPGHEGYNYALYGAENVTNLTLIADVPGRFPVTEWVFDNSGPAYKFFTLRREIAR